MNAEEFKIETARKEHERAVLELETAKEDQEFSSKIRKQNLTSAEQEMIRRGIETMVLVIKNQSDYRGTEVVKHAYDKLLNFIDALKLPK